MKKIFPQVLLLHQGGEQGPFRPGGGAEASRRPPPLSPPVGLKRKVLGREGAIEAGLRDHAQATPPQGGRAEAEEVRGNSLKTFELSKASTLVIGAQVGL